MSMPFEPLNVGDIHDDDAQVIDDFVQPQADPPKPLPDVMVTEVVKRPTPVTRIQTGRQILVAGWEPVLLLPKDEYRKSMWLAVSSLVAADVVYVADTATAARMGGAVYAANPIPFHEHTGALWVYNPGVTDVTVSWWSVTK